MSAEGVISSETRETKSVITDTKLYVLLVTLSIKNNTKLQQQLKSGFIRKLTGININQKCH